MGRVSLKIAHSAVYWSADKFLARPTSRCILFVGENISFDASIFMYINFTNIPPIMIINRIYETQNLLKLSVYHPGVFTKPNKMVFTSQTHLFITVLNVLFGQHVSTRY